jgi:hypothetical protein
LLINSIPSKKSIDILVIMMYNTVADERLSAIRVQLQAVGAAAVAVSRAFAALRRNMPEIPIYA